MSNQSVAYFLIAVKNAHGGYVPVGQVANGSKLRCDERAAKFFPASTKARESVLKACRWCNNERITPNFLDMVIQKGSTTQELRVFCIR